MDTKCYVNLSPLSDSERVSTSMLKQQFQIWIYFIAWLIKVLMNVALWKIMRMCYKMLFWKSLSFCLLTNLFQNWRANWQRGNVFSCCLMQVHLWSMICFWSITVQILEWRRKRYAYATQIWVQKKICRSVHLKLNFLSRFGLFSFYS